MEVGFFGADVAVFFAAGFLVAGFAGCLAVGFFSAGVFSLRLVAMSSS